MTCEWPDCEDGEQLEDNLCAAHRARAEEIRARTRQQQQEEARERAAAIRSDERDERPADQSAPAVADG